jgi:flagellar basal-body rod protein FlgB
LAKSDGANMVSQIDNYLRFQETVLSVRGQRQQLLASNIANADTPNYKAKDIDFNAAMKNALHQGVAQNALPLNKTSDQHLDVANSQSGIQPQYRKTVEGSVDGNTVDMDTERNQFAENAVQYESSLQVLSMQIHNLLTAITTQ